jgi:hypothetical protein
MSGGADAIVQARPEHGAWAAGWARVKRSVLRVDGQGRFGCWRYEPVETKRQPRRPLPLPPAAAPR